MKASANRLLKFLKEAPQVTIPIFLRKRSVPSLVMSTGQ